MFCKSRQWREELLGVTVAITEHSITMKESGWRNRYNENGRGGKNIYEEAVGCHAQVWRIATLEAGLLHLLNGY